MTVTKKKELILYVSVLNNLFVTVISKKTVFKTFSPMSRSGFLNKVPGQSIFKGATSRSPVVFMFRLMPIAF